MRSFIGDDFKKANIAGSTVVDSLDSCFGEMIAVMASVKYRLKRLFLGNSLACKNIYILKNKERERIGDLFLKKRDGRRGS